MGRRDCQNLFLPLLAVFLMHFCLSMSSNNTFASISEYPLIRNISFTLNSFTLSIILIILLKGTLDWSATFVFGICSKISEKGTTFPVSITIFTVLCLLSFIIFKDRNKCAIKISILLIIR